MAENTRLRNIADYLSHQAFALSELAHRIVDKAEDSDTYGVDMLVVDLDQLDSRITTGIDDLLAELYGDEDNDDDDCHCGQECSCEPTDATLSDGELTFLNTGYIDETNTPNFSFDDLLNLLRDFKL